MRLSKLKVTVGALAGMTVCLAEPQVNPLSLPLFFIPLGAIAVGFCRYGFLFTIPYLVMFDGMNKTIIGKMQTVEPMRIWAVLTGGQLLLILVVAAARRRRAAGSRSFADAPAYETLLLAFFVGMSVLSAVVGVLHGNANIYVLSDTYNCIVIAAVYLLVQLAADSADAKFLLGAAALGEFAGGLFLTGERLLSAFQSNVVRLGGPSVLPLVYFLLCFLHAKRRGQRLIFQALFLGTVITVLATNSRACCVEAVAALFLTLLIERKEGRKSLGRVVSTLVFLVPLGGLLVAFPVTRGALKTLYTDTESKFMRETFVNGELGASGTAKIEEINVALDGTVRSGNISQAVLGNGSGAQFLEWSEVLDKSLYRNALPFTTGLMTHNIHNTYSAVLFRMGILGMVLFLAFIYSLFRVLGTLLLGSAQLAPGDRRVLQVLFVFMVVSFTLELNTVYTLFGHVLWGVLLGILGISTRK